MDDIVRQALVKWPHVPHCYGWLGLDARGHWRMRDQQAQQQQLPGDKIAHAALLNFINRNYAPDERGCWFFQNGPQRVYVELEATPWVWRLQPQDLRAVSHTGREAAVRRCLLDELGRVYLETDLGLGLVHTLDVALAAEAVTDGRWTPEDVQAKDLPARYGYVCSPRARSQAGASRPN